MGIRAAAAFHPKILLLAGAKSGLAIVGSHNLTFSGFGHNREVSTLVSIAGKSDAEGVNFAREIWTFLRSWIDHEKDRLPPEVLATAQKAGNTVGWLRGKVDSSSSSITFMGKQPSGPSLWSQLKPTLPNRVSRVTLVGPFFDKGLRLPIAMREELGSSEIVIGIDPGTVEIDPGTPGDRDLRFVNAQAFGPHSRYLHAKIAYLEDEGGDHTLVLGSANPSSPAWLEDGSRGNAEAVVVHRGSRARDIAEQLGIPRLHDSPVLDETHWAEIRSRKPRESATADSSHAAYAVGVETGSGVEIVDERFSTLHVEQAFLLQAEGRARTRLSPVQQSGIKTFIPIEPEELSSVRLIELQCSDGTSLLSFIHHGAQLDSRCQTSRQSSLRAALSALDGETTDIAGLVMLCDKMIFSPDAQVEPPPPAARKSGTNAHSDANSEAEEEPIEGLAASINDSRKAKRRQRRLSQDGDLGSVLDFLVYRLGVNANASTAGLDSKGRNEEERRGSDDEEEGRSPIPMEMVQSCRKKVKTLVTRMAKQLAQVADEDHRRALAVIQLCAVISVLRELRVVDRNADWVGPGQTLVPIAERRRLLEVSVGYLFGEEHQLLRKSIEDREGEIFDEVSRLKGLLLWLAWDGGLRGDEMPRLSDSQDEKRSKLLDRARIVIVSRHVSGDAVANGEAEDSFVRASGEAVRTTAMSWLARGIGLGETVNVAAGVAPPVGGEIAGAACVGDLVSVQNGAEPRIVVREKQDKVFLADLHSGTPERGFLSNRTRVVLPLAT